MPSSGTVKTERSRLSAADWERAALALIAEQGVNALNVEGLARELGVTKGSFYWHFPSREALLNAALERWELDVERELSAEVVAASDPRARLRELFRRIAHEVQPHRVYAALLRALDHPRIQSLMARVSQRRMDFLALAYRQAGMQRGAASPRGRLTYAASVGFRHRDVPLGVPRLSQDEYEAYVEHVIDTFLADV
jgi:AcrR family transcriptional regulator